MKRNTSGIRNDVESRLMEGELEGGSEILQAVIVIGFAVGLSVAYLGLQGVFNDAISNAGDSVTNMFSKLSAGATS